MRCYIEKYGIKYIFATVQQCRELCKLYKVNATIYSLATNKQIGYV